MKVIVAGSRDTPDEETVRKALRKAGLMPHMITEVVSGVARGADRFGEKIARAHGIKVAYFPADWDKHGRKAGHLRNKQMAEYADMLVAIWDGVSRGTLSMITTMRAMEKPVHVHTYGRIN